MPGILVFDLFGTLVFFDDTRVPTAQIEGRSVPMTIRDLAALLRQWLPAITPPAFLEELRRVSIAIGEEKRRAQVEIPSRVRFERTLVALGADPASAFAWSVELARRHMDSLAGAVVCPPDRRDLLRELSRTHRLALLSNFDCAATARRVLAQAGLDAAFDVIVISEEEGLRKPATEIFARTCERMQAAPSRCLYIGDTLVEDIEGATRAGLSALWIHPDETALSPALAILPDVRELPRWLASSRTGSGR
ncbi:MAG TPA: HAD family hydrolase [Candidatus Binatia bacterium]